MTDAERDRIERLWKIRGMQISALRRRLATLERAQDVPFERAGGICVCATCGFEYRDHVVYPDISTFHLLCDGSIVKL